MSDNELSPKNMSGDQIQCYELLCDLMHGEHHLNKVQAFGRGIKMSVYSGQLSTFDFDYLTRLVIMAHDRCIRAEIIASGPGRVGVALFKRHTREGSINQRHPTIETAIASIRGSKDKS